MGEGVERTKAEKFLDLRPRDVVAFVGGGGKSTLIHALATRLAKEGRKVVTTATRPFLPAPGESPYIFLTEERPFGDLRPNLSEHGTITVAPERLPDGRLRGYDPSEVGTLADLGDYLFVEAEDAEGESLPDNSEGSRKVPDLATVLCIVAGLDALGPDLDSAAFARKLWSDPDGLLRSHAGIPRRVLFLHKADRKPVRMDGGRVAIEVRKQEDPLIPRAKILVTSVQDLLKRLD